MCEHEKAWRVVCTALFDVGWSGKVKKGESGLESAVRFIKKLAAISAKADSPPEGQK